MLERFLNQSIALSILLFSPVTAWATDADTGFWSVQLENDLWGSNDDRFYTHGTEVSYLSIEQPPGWLQSLAATLPFYLQGEISFHGYSIGQKIFTPEDISQTALITDDRPYAGWLFFETGIGHLKEDRGDRERVNALLLTVGIVGRSALAESMQREVHRIFKADKPQGWDNQLHDELGINVSYIRKWRNIYDIDEPHNYELSYHTGLTLGNVYTYASGGAMIRWGTHLKTDLGPPTISPGFPGVPAFNFNRQSNWYLFTGLETRLVLRNIFLDGNTFRDSHSVDREDIVADLQFGVAFHFNDMRLSFSQMLRSREFEGQKDNVQYGALNMTFFTE